MTRRLAREPDDAELHVALGVAAVAYGRGRTDFPIRPTLESALEDFRRALDAEPEHVMARVNLVQTLVFLGRKEEADSEAATGVDALGQTPHDEHFLLDHAGQIAIAPADKDEFAMEWERAGMRHAGCPEAEAAAKRALVPPRRACTRSWPA